MSEIVDEDSPRNSFSVVDLIIDVLLLITSFAVPIKVSDVNWMAGGFVQNAAHLGLLIVGYFGFAVYVARMYYSNAVKPRKKWPPRSVLPTIPRILFPSNSLLLFTWLLVINILFSAYNVFQIMALPIFTSLLVMVEALWFGFSFGLDFAIERHRATHPLDSVPRDNLFSQSLPSFLPYLLLTVVLIFPAEYFCGELQAPPLAAVILIGASCVASYFLGRALERGAFSKLKIKSAMNAATIVMVSFLMVTGFIGLDVLEILARTHIAIIEASAVGGLFILFLFGVVPLRIGIICFAKTSRFNRILGGIALAGYMAVQGQLVVVSWGL